MNKAQIIKKTAEFAKKTLEGEGSGHDWWHVYRVARLAKEIGKTEKADMFVVELAAMLHDISDWKFNGGDDKLGGKIARDFLLKNEVKDSIAKQVGEIINNLSYKGGTNREKMKTIEGMVVQDADRLDALGAIGVARAFTFGGHFGGKMHDPAIKAMTFENFEDFKEKMKVNTVINHFYEKLLRLKDLMNTKSGKRMAVKRHKYMEQFLDKFYKEWEGKE